MPPSPFSTIFSVYVSDLRSQITYLFVKFGCSICIFLNAANLKCQVRISHSVPEGPFDFEITRIDCIHILLSIDML